jgi:hypothetical protein
LSKLIDLTCVKQVSLKKYKMRLFSKESEHESKHK